MPEAIGRSRGYRRHCPKMEWVTSEEKPRLDHTGETKYPCDRPMVPRSD